MKNRLQAKLWAFALIGILLVAIPAAAQLTSADILGTVTDAAGAVVPNAKVTVMNLATSVSRTLQTNGSGEYVVNLLPSGAVQRHRGSAELQEIGHQCDVGRRRSRPRRRRATNR